MSNYNRVIPRDLFNEANLLKCYGQIYINLERISLDDVALHYDDEENGDQFNIAQDESNGGLFITNVHLIVNQVKQKLYRPLNSRDPFPLYLTDENDEDISVFNDDGTFTVEMMNYLKSHSINHSNDQPNL